MSRFGRVPRRPDHWSTPHERAQFRAAERIDTPLDPAEATWLDEHLADCDACRAVAGAYESDRLALRSLRDIQPEPPRDLWARTAARIELEAGGRGRSMRRVSGPSRLPLGALSGVAVIVIILGATALTGGWLRFAPGGNTASAAVGVNGQPAATPMLVAAGSVGWVHTLADGAYAYNVAALEQVCPVNDQPDCAALDDQASKRLALDTTPMSVIGSPTNGQAIVVGRDALGRQSIFAVSLPKAGTEPVPPRATPKPTPDSTPKPTPTVVVGSPVVTASVAPSPSVTPAVTSEATASAAPPVEPTQSAEPTATTEPSPAVTPVPSSGASLTPSPEPTIAANLAIASGVSVVGESAAFSADGAWFAFTARPADGSVGPDIYVWRVGEQQARRLTTDGLSVFASWQGALVIGSGLAPDDRVDGEYQPISFQLDPATGERTPVSTGLWRPAIDPSAAFAVAWDGSVLVPVADPVEMTPGKGHLRLVRWPADGNASGSVGDPIPGITGAISDFDVRWDETGSWLGIWVAEPAGPTIGRLTLLRLDRESGRLSRPDGAPTNTPALPGFSIGDGRLAWVTPHGQDAQGSKVQIVAWSGDGVGATESVPGEDVVVVR
jgi:Putative zinc-finger